MPLFFRDHTFDFFVSPSGYYALTWRIIAPLVKEDTFCASLYASVAAREDELFLDLGGCLDSGSLQ